MYKFSFEMQQELFSNMLNTQLATLLDCGLVFSTLCFFVLTEWTLPVVDLNCVNNGLSLSNELKIKDRQISFEYFQSHY